MVLALVMLTKFTGLKCGSKYSSEWKKNETIQRNTETQGAQEKIKNLLGFKPAVFCLWDKDYRPRVITALMIKMGLMSKALEKSHHSKDIV